MNNYRRLISMTLVFSIILSMLTFSSGVYAEDEPIAAPEIQEPDIITADYEILHGGKINTARLTKLGVFSALSASEKDAVCTYYNLSANMFTACEKLGYSIIDSVHIARSAQEAELTPAEYKEYLQGYGGDEELTNRELAMYKYHSAELSQSRKTEISSMMKSGYSMSDIIWTLPVAEKLSCQISDIMAEDTTETDIFYQTYNVDPEKLEQVAASKKTSVSAVIRELEYEEETAELTTVNAEATAELNSTSTDGDNLPQPAMSHELISAPGVYFAGTNEQVSASSGGFSYRETLFDMPGINGMDLSVDLVFSSGSNLYYGKTYGDLNDVRDWYTRNSSLLDEYDTEYSKIPIQSVIGAGWSFDLPSISCVMEYTDPANFTYASIASKEVITYYNMPGGGKYRVIWDSEQSKYVLEDYKKNDVTFLNVTNTTSTNGTEVSYRVERINGSYELYNWDGNIIEIGDKYGNKVFYDYYSSQDNLTSEDTPGISVPNTNSYRLGKLQRISDNTGRYAQFIYVIVNNQLWTRIIVSDTSDPDTRQDYQFFAELATYQNEVTNETETILDIYALESCMLNNKVLNFTYEYPEIRIVDRKYTDDITEFNGENRVINMTSIEYETGLTSYYEYEKFISNNGQYGAKESYRVKNRHETHKYVDGETTTESAHKKTATYSYVNDYSGYSARATAAEADKLLYADPDELPASYTYKVLKTENGITTETTFNNNHLPTQVRTLNASTNAVISTSTTSYDTYELPIAQSTTTGVVSTSQMMQNDQYGNVVKSWSAKANGLENSEYLTQYTYDNRYNMLTGKTYKTNANTTVSEAYTLSTDGKQVTGKTVSVNGSVKESVTYTYDSYGNVIQQVTSNPGGTNHVITYSYDDSEDIDRGYGVDPFETDENFQIDINLDGVFPTSVTENGRTTTYTYDLDGRQLKVVDAANNATTMEYDDRARIKKITNPDNTTQQFSYILSRAENSVTFTDEMGTQTKYYYDDASNVERITDVTSGENLHSYTYDNFYRMTSEQNVQLLSSGHTIHYSYDLQGRLTAKETKDTSNTTVAKETYAYDDATQDPFITTTHTVVGDTYAPSIVNKEYVNSYGEVAKIGMVTGANEYFTTYTYDYVGNPLTEKSALADQKDWTNAYTKAWDYDYAGRVLKEYNADGKYVQYEYDSLGRVTKMYDPVATALTTPYYTSYTYNSYGDLASETVPQTQTTNRVTEYTYDNLGRVTLERKLHDIVDGEARYISTAYTYDWRGNVLTSTLDNVTTTNSYDNLGRLTRSSTGSPIDYTYDRFGNVLTIKFGGKTDAYEYDMNGFNTQHIDKSGTVITYIPTALGQIASTATPNSSSRTIEYSLTGQIAEIEGRYNEYIRRRYNDRGFMTQELESDVNKVYTYDIAGKRETFSATLTNATSPAMSLSYTYNALEQLTAVNQNGSQLVSYTYDNNGNLLSENKAAVNISSAYNRDNSVISNTSSNNLVTDVRSSAYTYYLDGNIKTDNTTGNPTKTYTYNNRNMVATETLSTGQVTSYTYDYRGNRTNKTTTLGESQSVTTYAYVAATNLLTRETTQHSNGESSIAYYYYDDDNNLILRGHETRKIGPVENIMTVGTISPVVDAFAYNDFGELTSATVNAVTTTYKYRPDGLRKSKDTLGATTTHVWDGDDVVMDLNLDRSIKAKYPRGINLIELDDGTTAKQQYSFNYHGDVISTVNSSTGDRIGYDYDAYGNQLSAPANDANPFRYSGEYYDSETGFIYLRARYYDTTTGRFISSDPARDGVNWYAYCAGNPVMYIDPSGMAPTKEEAAYMAEHIYRHDKSSSKKDRTIAGWRLIDVFDGGAVSSVKLGIYIRDGEDWQNPSEYALVFRGSTLSLDMETASVWANNLLAYGSNASVDMWAAIGAAVYF